jgi:hypothetical protein
MKEKAAFSLILQLFITFFSGCTTLLGTFEYVGDKSPVTVPRKIYTVIILDFQLGIGSITLEAESNASYLVNVENKVSIREGSDGTLENAVEVSYSEINSETVKVEFDSNDQGIMIDYSYEIIINVATNVTLQIDFAASTGDISTSITDSEVNISSLDLETSTGSITLELQDVQISDSSPTIVSSTGEHSITLLNIKCTGSTTWSISTSTGFINVHISTFNNPANNTITHKFNISASTGSISVTANLLSQNGLKITTSVSTGTITIPTGGESYISDSFNTATHKYDFNLSTTTGDITFSSG